MRRRRPRDYRLTLAALVMSAMAFSLSQTMVVPAMPEIQRELGASTEAAAFVLTAFLLGASVATPIVGRFGDMFGKASVLVLAMSIFGIGAAAAALADSMAGVIAGRALQGVGGGVFPLSFGIIRDEFPAHRVGVGIGLVGSTFGAGGALGFLFSGWVIDATGYQGVFWVCVATVVVAVTATVLFVPESPVRAPAPIDWSGAGLLAAELACLLIGISRGNAWGWGSTRILSLGAAAAVLFLIWGRTEWRQSHPLVDMRMMREPAVVTTNLAALLVGFGLFGTFILVPQLVEAPVSTGYGFGATTSESALYLVPLGAFMLLAAPLSGWMADRRDPKLPLLLGIGLAATSYVMLALFHRDAWTIYLALAVLDA